MAVLSFFFAFLFVLLVSIIWKRKKYANSLPPGPPALPLVGNLLQFDLKNIRQTFLDWHKKHGPVFTVWLGTTPNVFVTDYDLMQELFVKRGDEFSYRPDSYIFELFSNGNFGILNTNGEMWKEQRRFSLHTLRNFGFGRKIMEEKINVELAKLIDSVNEKANEKGEKSGGGNFDLKPLLEVCISNIISSVVVGITYEPDHPSIKRLSKALENNVKLFAMFRTHLLNTFPWLRFVPILGRFGYTNLLENIDGFLGVLNVELLKRKQDFQKEIQDDPNYEPTDFASAYWQEMKRRNSAGEDMGYFSDWQLTSLCGDIWAAGLTTTVVTLYWSILLLGYHEEVQEKVQQEIDRVVGNARRPNMADRNEMPYTTAVLHEVQRYGNILTVNIPHTVIKDTKILNYTIPAGTVIVPQISVVHYDEKFFADPTKFDPTRFLEADGQTLKKTDHLMPFSLGKRQCMGESLARMELFLVFTSVLQKFSFRFPTNQPKPTLNSDVGFNSTPLPYEVRAIRRT